MLIMKIKRLLEGLPKLKEEKMAKKIVVTLILAIMVAGGVFAQEKKWFNSYAPGVEGGKIFVNAGIGYGVLPYKLSLPPISGSVEYALRNIPLSLGGYFGIAQYKEELGIAEYGGTMMGFGAKASWHFNVMQKLDPYVSLNLGWMVYTQTVSTAEQDVGAVTIPGTESEADLSAFYYAFNLGARYFFTNNIGAYLEVGYSAISVVSVGLTLKF
jgi:hypothetical protein